MNFFNFETEISIFESQVSKEMSELVTVEEALMMIKQGTYRVEVMKLRAGDKKVKRFELPSVAFHGVFEGERLKNNFSEASGLIILDIDNVPFEELEETKNQIMREQPSCLACFVSPSGDGLKCLYFVEKEDVDVDTYKPIGRKIGDKFKKYGDIDVLSITDCLIMSYDPDIRINREAMLDEEAGYIETKKLNQQLLDPLDKNKKLFDDVEEFFEKVLLDEIVQKSDNNYHFIQMALFDLARFGFYHPEEDLSFVISYSEDTHKKSKENESRFVEAALKAKDIPQEKWPYKFQGEKSPMLGSGNSWDEDDAPYFDEDPIEPDEEEGVEIDEEALKIFMSDEEFEEEFLQRIEEGDYAGTTTSFTNLNEAIRFGVGVYVVTGRSGMGKTEFLDAITTDLSLLHDWSHVVYSSEQEVSEHVKKISQRVVGRRFKSKEYTEEVEEVKGWVRDHFLHIDAAKTTNIDKILRATEVAISMNRSIRSLVIDPLNKLTCKGVVPKSLEFDNIVMQKLTQFALRMKITIFLVAHPIKDPNRKAKRETAQPWLEDISGSGDIGNMAHYAIVIHRDKYDEESIVEVMVLKCKQSNMGVNGKKVYFKYNLKSTRYLEVDSYGNYLKPSAMKNWLK